MKTQTWANGFGVWHCKVEAPQETTMERARRCAREAIRKELEERSRGEQFVIRLKVVDMRREADRLIAVYKER